MNDAAAPSEDEDSRTSTGTKGPRSDIAEGERLSVIIIAVMVLVAIQAAVWALKSLKDDQFTDMVVAVTVMGATSTVAQLLIARYRHGRRQLT